MQPTYLPWIGYFSLIKDVDVFIFLNDVQFSSRSWQQRNRILSQSGPIWLTVPIHLPNGRPTLIQEAEIVQDQKFALKHIKSIKMSYEKSVGYEHIKNHIFPILEQNFKYIQDLNVSLIKEFCKLLEIETVFKYSSEFDSEGAKGFRLAAIAKKVAADSYLSPPGSKDYLVDFDGFAKVGIELKYKDYKLHPYTQKNSEFIPNLSIIDVICNLGVSETIRMLNS
jgi:hypothetical protein